MGKPKPPFTPEPRGWNLFQVVTYLGISEATFHAQAAAYDRAGFPKPNAITGRYDRRAIDLWLDAQSGLRDDANTPQPAASIGAYDPFLSALG
jgi:hypothetical protein